MPFCLCRPCATRLLLHQRHSTVVLNQRVLQPCVVLPRGLWGVPDCGRRLLRRGRPSWPVCQSNSLPVGVVLRDRRPILVFCWTLWSSSWRNVAGVHGGLHTRPLLPCRIHGPNARALWSTHHVLPSGTCTRVVCRCTYDCCCLTGAFIHAVHHCTVSVFAQGTDVRLIVGPGSFSTPVTDVEVNRWGQALCPAGSYCVGGVRALCPGGRFGNATSMTSPACSGPCPAGYYCPPGATSPDHLQCGASAVYCPPGSAAPSQALPGEYTIGGETASTRSASAPCPAGSYCINGTAEPCPAGRFGCADRLSGIGCNGLCVRAEILLLNACTQHFLYLRWHVLGVTRNTSSIVPDVLDYCLDLQAPGFFCPTGSTSSQAYVRQPSSVMNGLKQCTCIKLHSFVTL